jgi:YVTN family beta-propeller protein
MKESIAKAGVLAMLGLFGSAALAAPQVYIPLGAANSIQVVDAATTLAVATIKDVPQVHGLAATPDGRYLVAGSFTEVSAPTGNLPPKPEGMSSEEHEKHHAISPEPSENPVGASYVSIIESSSREVVRRIEVRGSVHHVAVTPDSRFAVTTHPGAGGVSVIDLDTFERSGAIATGTAPNYATFSSDGERLYVSNTGDNNVSEIDVRTWQVTRTFPTGKAPEHVVLSPDDRVLYVNNVADGTVSAIQLINDSTAQTYPVGSDPHGVDLLDDGNTLFATSKTEGRLVAIDLRTGKITAKALGPAPYHVTAIRGTGTLYVSSRAEPRIWVVDQDTLELRDEFAIPGIGHQMVLTSN